MNIYQKLLIVQSKLKAPKGQYNKFGKFKYRTLEDIMEGIKPLLVQQQLALLISDTVKQIGDRFYIEAKALLVNIEKPDEQIITTAVAREAANKKGMDDSQITGSTSSYARKYCLNGLFTIDDTKDSDARQNYPEQKNNSRPPQPPGLSKEQLDWLSNFCKQKGYTDNQSKKQFMDFYGFSPRTTSPNDFIKIQQRIESEDAVSLN